jgi:hypothetical protein
MIKMEGENMPANTLLKTEEKEIQRVVLDYIDGWYEGNEERMARTLHPNMVKRIIENPNSESVLHELDWQTMVEYTKNGGGKDVPKTDYEISVTILDISDNIASVKTESEYIDYLHLAKFNNQWSIINVLWDFKRRY